jgi:hypothetical protein
LNASPSDLIRSLEVCFSRHPDSDGKMSRSGHSVFLRSKWLGKKIYSKGQEFHDVERKKRPFYSDKYCNEGTEICSGDLVPLSIHEISDLMRMIRFECEFKSPYLKRYEVQRIQDIERLCERFELEKAKYTNVTVLIDGDVRLSAREEQVINLVRRVGLLEAKKGYVQAHSERTWYRIKRELAARSIHLEALDNIEQRSTGPEIFHDRKKIEFQLIPAPYADEEPYAVQEKLFAGGR